MRDRRGIDERATSGRISVVHAQIALVVVVVIGQLWLLTVAWNLSQLGQVVGVVAATIASGLGFLVSLGTLLVYRE